MRTFTTLLALPVAAVVGLAIAPAPVAAASGTELISGTQAGQAGDHDSYFPTLSPDARYVTFLSYAANLAGTGRLEHSQLLLRDQQSGKIELVSTGPSGEPANSFTSGGALSADGRYVVFATNATNILPGLTTAADRSYRRDRQTGTTILITANSQGEPANAYTGTASLSADGRYAAFSSTATNLVPGDTNKQSDVFVRDLVTGAVQRVSLNADGSERAGPSFVPVISGNGRFVLYRNDEFDVRKVGLYLVDRVTNTVEDVSVDSAGHRPELPYIEAADLSDDGRHVAFVSRSAGYAAGDTNEVADVFVRDRTAGTTTLVSLETDGTPSVKRSLSLDMTPDGSRVVFTREIRKPLPASGPTEIFLWRSESRSVRKVTADGTTPTRSLGGSISADGRRIAFWSYHPFAAGDTNDRPDVYLRTL